MDFLLRRWRDAEISLMTFRLFMEPIDDITDDLIGLSC